MSFTTTDLCDAHADCVQIADPMFRDFGGRAACHGPAMTLRVFEDNSLVRETLETAGAGRVLIVDGGGSLRCALLGDNVAQLAIDNDWAGVIVFGCVRDTARMERMPVVVKALAAHPLRSRKLGSGEREVAVRFAGVRVTPGDHIYADRDGILVSDGLLSVSGDAATGSA